MYDCIDGMFENLFSHPPAPDAQMETEFTYMTYRIAIEQDGTATFVSAE